MIIIIIINNNKIVKTSERTEWRISLGSSILVNTKPLASISGTSTPYMVSLSAYLLSKNAREALPHVEKLSKFGSPLCPD